MGDERGFGPEVPGDGSGHTAPVGFPAIDRVETGPQVMGDRPTLAELCGGEPFVPSPLQRFAAAMNGKLADCYSDDRYPTVDEYAAALAEAEAELSPTPTPQEQGEQKP